MTFNDTFSWFGQPQVRFDSGRVAIGAFHKNLLYDVHVFDIATGNKLLSVAEHLHLEAKGKLLFSLEKNRLLVLNQDTLVALNYWMWKSAAKLGHNEKVDILVTVDVKKIINIIIPAFDFVNFSKINIIINKFKSIFLEN